MEVPSKPRGRSGSGKYLFWDEVRATWFVGASILIFQHFARERREDHIARLIGQLEDSAPGGLVAALQASHVVFLLAIQPIHGPLFDKGLNIIKSRWGDRVWEWGNDLDLQPETVMAASTGVDLETGRSLWSWLRRSLSRK